MPVPLAQDDYLELLPVRWQAITERGIRLNHRTYDCDLLGPYRGQPSPITSRGGKWEVHTNPHDIRQIWCACPTETGRDPVDPPRPRPPALRRTDVAARPHHPHPPHRPRQP
ncbi:Mu transposase C-terminal domain-containing protein [Streptomyces sp. NPDC053069]|uniref:Mu transposase C-terminal domain-containing protein n=1 Tax=Streptomyces sp. NPDC053069 TaxID=3365695 RepID=UPI0037D59A3B